MKYADVILPVPVDEYFTYAAPDDLTAGSHVTVQLGARRLKGVVRCVHTTRPDYKIIKEIIEVNEGMLVSEPQMKYWEWLALYYMCAVGEVMKAALPTSIKKPIRIRKEIKTKDSSLPQLSAIQLDAFNKTTDSFEQKKCVLLHGVTGSGKTEVYIHLIAEALSQGKDALYLVPEIALTAQLVKRLENHFNTRVKVYHSRSTAVRRGECYEELNKTDREPILILGVRSSLLLPFNNLGIIVIDEEHENTYKQYEPAPRYHARDAAIVLASQCGANVILGSATPSVESYFNAITGKYALVEITERYSGVMMPKIIVSDTLKAAKRGEKISHFNTLLLNKIDSTLLNNKQVILFQNRRGFSPYIECSECSETPSCKHCNVTLTYHKSTESLVCHYCGYTETMPSKCPNCGAETLKPMGFGTEKIEEELQKIFPEAVIARLDMDAARSAKRYNDIVSNFSNGKIDILVGTQMISKGFDFDNVSLVGILNADNMLNFPDFRAAERSFQLMTQVAGRAGRRETQGEVVVQSSQTENPIIKQLQTGDYHSMFHYQLSERKSFLYPPYCRLIGFTFKHRHKDILDKAANEFGAAMKKVFGRRLLGPETPSVDKVRDEHLTGFLLKIEREKSFAQAKRIIRAQLSVLEKKYPSLTVIADVDPI